MPVISAMQIFRILKSSPNDYPKSTVKPLQMCTRRFPDHSEKNLAWISPDTPGLLLVSEAESLFQCQAEEELDSRADIILVEMQDA